MKTQKIILMLICMIAFNNYGFSQNLVWAKSIGGPSHDFRTNMLLDNSDNLYVVAYDDSIYKFNSQGVQLWAKAFQGLARINKMVVDNQQNIYAIGEFADTVDFDLGPADYLLSTTGINTQEGFVLKMDLSGNFIWAKQFQNVGGSGTCLGLTIDVDGLGNAYVGGLFFNSFDFDPSGNTAILSAAWWDMYVCKLDLSGNFIWVKSFSSSSNSEILKSIVIDNSGDVIISGNHEGTMDYDPGPGVENHTSSGSHDDAFIIKLDASGQYVWGKQYGCDSFDLNSAMKKDLNGEIIGCGYYTNTLNFTIPSPMVSLNSAGNSDGYTFKIQPNGQLVWIKEFKGLSVNTVTATAFGPGNSIYSFGYFSGEIDLDPNAGNALYNNTEGFDLFVSILSQGGAFQGAVQLGYTDKGAYSQQIEVNSNGEMYLLGYYSDTLDADPGPADQLLISEGFSDIFIIKLNTITSVDELNSWQNDITIFPNPATNIVQVQLPEQNYGDGKILLYNNLGQLQLETEIVDGTNQHAIQIDKLPQGMYYIHIRTNSKTYVRKIIKS